MMSVTAPGVAAPAAPEGALAAAPQYLDAGAVADLLPYDRLIDALEAAFGSPCEAPPRTLLSVGAADRRDLVALMPAWRAGERFCLKVASVFRDNGRRGLPTVQAVVIVVDGNDGRIVAMLDGTELTRRRTAATSALAARHLARPDASTLLVAGTGALAPHLAEAHRTVRAIKRVWVWGRSTERISRCCEDIRRRLGDVTVAPAPALEEAAREADIISCATSATEPFLRAAWLKPGVHVDLVGSFSPTAREAESEVIARARVFVDTYEGALAEAGDLLIPLQERRIGREHIVGDLAWLVRHGAAARRSAQEWTLFKSVGSAIEDLAAAELALRSLEAA